MQIALSRLVQHNELWVNLLQERLQGLRGVVRPVQAHTGHQLAKCYKRFKYFEQRLVKTSVRKYQQDLRVRRKPRHETRNLLFWNQLAQLWFVTVLGHCFRRSFFAVLGQVLKNRQNRLRVQVVFRDLPAFEFDLWVGFILGQI
ncbi:Hypothetical_protein [Hexamita inflata]|uniref:Hypothetical_protein n=1 Tax=Hexamita inflata TaxID=28002 RepID=A0AA86RQA4_9EUKA|nr:Hypothetical protein HINF_LOCUS65303 [Hexamita inflata]